MKSQSTPILIVEDNAALAIGIEYALRQSPLAEGKYMQIVASTRMLFTQLNKQREGVVELVILDYEVYGGQTSAQQIPRLKEHPALKQGCWIIGWSAYPTAAESFQAFGADGFVAKNLGIDKAVMYFDTIIQRRQKGEAWVSYNI